jgi:hypothetical protein
VPVILLFALDMEIGDSRSMGLQARVVDPMGHSLLVIGFGPLRGRRDTYIA